MSDDSGSTKGALTCEAVRHFRVALPPLHEQQAILQWIRGEVADIDALSKCADREIDLLREYRTRLIADVVTGKLDVREAAARLPDEPNDPEPLDEPEAEDDIDNARADDADESPEEAEA